MPVASEIWMSGGGLRRWRSSNGIVNTVETMFDGGVRRSAALEIGLERKIAAVDGIGNATAIAGVNSEDADTLTYAPWFHWLKSSIRDESVYEYTVKDTLLGDRSAFALSWDGTATQSVSYSSGSSRMSSWEFDFPDSWFEEDGVVDQKATFTYTAGGAIAEIDWELRPIAGSWTYDSTTFVTYDGAERMASWDGVTFAYDSRNLRTRKVDDLGTITDFWYDDGGQLQAELGCDASCDENEARPLKEYVWLGGRPIAMIVSALDDTGEASDASVAIYDIHTGLLSEPLVITSAMQTREYMRLHSPFWEFEFEDPEPWNTSLRFPGQYEDVETGLFYNHNRYYWPVVGRYTSADPLAVVTPGWRQPVYAYGMNDPVGYYDPLGLACVGPNWDLTSYVATWGHRMEGITNANSMGFLLTCPCPEENVDNVRVEYGSVTGLFDTPKEPGMRDLTGLAAVIEFGGWVRSDLGSCL